MIQFVKNLYQYRELLFTLTASGIRTRYKQTILGISWAVLQPLALMSVSVVVFSVFARFPSDGLPYTLFAYAGLLPWMFHSTALSNAVTGLTSNVSLLRKVYFPREIFVVTHILTALVDYGIAAVLLLGMLLYYRIPLHASILYLPIILLTQIILVTGLSLISSIANVAFRDIARAMPVVLQIWMLASPVFYPLSMVPPQWRTWYALNPMVGIIEGYRKVWLEGEPPTLDLLVISALGAALVFIVGYALFRRGEEIVSDIV